MAITKSAKKRIKSSERKAVFNIRRARVMKDSVKEVTGALVAKDTKKAQELLSKAFQALDKAAKRGVIKKETAARKKSRLAKKVSPSPKK